MPEQPQIIRDARAAILTRFHALCSMRTAAKDRGIEHCNPRRVVEFKGVPLK